MIGALSSEVPNWTKWFALWALKSRTEPNDLRSEVPNWSKLFALWSLELKQIICALKSRTEANYLRSEVSNWTAVHESSTVRTHKRCFIKHYRQDEMKMPMTHFWGQLVPSEIHKLPRCVLTLKRAAFIFIQGHHFFLKFNQPFLQWNWKTSWNYKWRLFLNHLVYLQICLCSVFTLRKEIYF